MAACVHVTNQEMQSFSQPAGNAPNPAPPQINNYYRPPPSYLSPLFSAPQTVEEERCCHMRLNACLMQCEIIPILVLVILTFIGMNSALSAID